MGLQAQGARSRFLESIKRDTAAITQTAVLRQCIEPNEATIFGKEHRFSSIRTLDEYRAAVPVRHYADLQPWIDRAADGEPAVLTGEPPIRFWKTTGTTSQPKRLPVTRASAARVADSWL